MTELQNDGITELQKDRQGKSSIAPELSSNIIKYAPYLFLRVLLFGLSVLFVIDNSITAFFTFFVQMLLISVKLAEWLHFGKEQFTLLTIHSLIFSYTLSICNFNYFSFWFREQDFG